MRKWVCLIILSLCYTTAAHAQNYRKNEINIENFVEELFGMQTGDEDYEDLYEGLLQLLLNPVALNKATPEEMKSVFILTPIQISNFFEYRASFGPLISIYELQAIPEFDLVTIYKLLPFVTLQEREQIQGSLWDRVRSSRESYLILRQRRIWETRRGFTPADTLSGGRISSRYLGDPNDVYGRFRIQHSKDFSLGFTIDKDPGEQFIWDTDTKRYGFNFLSYHATLYNKGNWKAITVGDYQLQFGQGLVFGAGFSVGKGAETITTVRRSSIGIRPYTAAMEFGFFRGIAATRHIGRVQLTLMVSDSPRDGNVQTSLDTLEREDAFIASLQSSGLHRTPTEIGYKSQVREQNVGANVHYVSQDRNLQIGGNTLFTRFSQPFHRTPRLYNQFEFFGQSNHIQSIYFAYNFQNHYFFGESAISKSGGQGSVLGVMSSLHPKIGFSMLYRNFDRNFHTFYGNAFAEGTRPINERGFYLGLNFKPNRFYSWSFYYDRFKFPWLRYRVYAPSSGHEWMSRFSYTPSRNLLLFVQVREESKARNISQYEGFQSPYLLDQGKRYNYIFNLDYAINKHWSLKSRVQGSAFYFNQNKTTGFAISQDLNVDYQRWRISSRLVLFDTEDWDNRQYIYERNVLWLFSIPALSGQGMRYYLVGQYRISPKLTFWTRFARTMYTDREIIGTGLQQIQGNRITETTVQLRYQFNR